MINRISSKQCGCLHRILSSIIVTAFLSFSVLPPAFSQNLSVSNLPLPGTMVPLSQSFAPVNILGVTVHPEDPLQFDFIIDTGDKNLQGDALREESKKVIKYFLASLTVPEDEMWVNLSPYEKDRIIADGLGNTELGRDLLAQDYILKQLTATLMFPENELGKEFWRRVYGKANELYGSVPVIPMDTFNKIWIVPDTASIYVNGTSAFVVESHLKVMLEEDYLALESNKGSIKHGVGQVPADSDTNKINALTSDEVRAILIPEIEKEVNEGENFAALRQMYHSMILASWYKDNLRESFLGSVYIDKNKTEGVNAQDKQFKQKIYGQYLEAFKKGVFNYIKEDYDASTQQVVSRNYFSGGFDAAQLAKTEVEPTEAWINDKAGRTMVIQQVKLKSGDGSAIRWSGKDLTTVQHDIVNFIIAQYFNDPSKKSKRQLLDVDSREYKSLDPNGVLKKAQIRIYVFDGLIEGINVLADQSGVESPDDLVTHPGQTRGNLYLDRDVLNTILNEQSLQWRTDWANHELAHIQNQTLREADVQKIAPLPFTPPLVGERVVTPDGQEGVVVENIEVNVEGGKRSSVTVELSNKAKVVYSGAEDIKKLIPANKGVNQEVNGTDQSTVETIISYIESELKKGKRIPGRVAINDATKITQWQIAQLMPMITPILMQKGYTEAVQVWEAAEAKRDLSKAKLAVERIKEMFAQDAKRNALPSMRELQTLIGVAKGSDYIADILILLRATGDRRLQAAATKWEEDALSRGAFDLQSGIGYVRTYLNTHDEMPPEPWLAERLGLSAGGIANRMRELVDAVKATGDDKMVKAAESWLKNRAQDSRVVDVAEAVQVVRAAFVSDTTRTTMLSKMKIAEVMGINESSLGPYMYEILQELQNLGDPRITQAVIEYRQALAQRGKVKEGNGDSAMVVDDKDVGGIDFNRGMLDLKVGGDVQSIEFAFPEELRDVNVNLNGFTPLIINITPVTNFPLLLGLNEKQKDSKLSSL